MSDLYREATEHDRLDRRCEFRDVVPVPGPAYTINLKTEKPIPGRYLANDSDLVSYLKGRGVLVEIGDER